MYMCTYLPTYLCTYMHTYLTTHPPTYFCVEQKCEQLALILCVCVVVFFLSYSYPPGV